MTTAEFRSLNADPLFLLKTPEYTFGETDVDQLRRVRVSTGK